MAALRVGDEIAGHRILAELGRGGMGVVYRVLQLTLDDERALKVIIPELAAQEEFRSRFLREVRAAARVKHPNVLSVHSADEVDGQLFVSMPLVQGGDLGELIEQRGRLSPEEAMPPLDQIAAALDAAHARGLIHRDVKPANVLIDEHGHVYLSDFGLARALGSKTNFTATGTWVGTPEYMAPEQFGAGSPSERSDVYSLGCVLFEMLTGRAVFADADSLPAKIGAHMFTEPPALTERAPELPQALERVINTALAKSPEDRHASAGELALAAARALEGPQEAASENGGAPAAEAPPRPEPASEETSGPAPATRRAPPPSWLASRSDASARRPTRRRRRLALGAVAIVVAAVIVVVFVVVFDEDSSSSPDPPPFEPAAVENELVAVDWADRTAAEAQCEGAQGGAINCVVLFESGEQIDVSVTEGENPGELHLDIPD